MVSCSLPRTAARRVFAGVAGVCLLSLRTGGGDNAPSLAATALTMKRATYMRASSSVTAVADGSSTPWSNFSQAGFLSREAPRAGLPAGFERVEKMAAEIPEWIAHFKEMIAPIEKELEVAEGRVKLLEHADTG